MNEFNRETGQRNRRYRRDSEYHLSPRCPRRGAPREDRSSIPQERDRSYQPPVASISTETPASPQKAESVGGSRAGCKSEQRFVATAAPGKHFCSHRRMARRRWILARRPILRALVGLRAIIVSWGDVGFQHKRDSALAAGALERYARQRMF